MRNLEFVLTGRQELDGIVLAQKRPKAVFHSLFATDKLAIVFNPEGQQDSGDFAAAVLEVRLTVRLSWSRLLVGANLDTSVTKVGLESALRKVEPVSN